MSAGGNGPRTFPFTPALPLPRPHKPFSYTPCPAVSLFLQGEIQQAFQEHGPLPSQKSDKSARGWRVRDRAGGADTPPPPPAAAVPLPPCASQERGGTDLTCTSPRPSRRTSRAAFADLPPEPDDPLLGFAPYIHRAPRRNSITPERQREFIAVLAATGIVTQAARRIGASLEALYRLRNQPGAEGFAAAWEAAIDRGMARLEDCALERAIMGEERPILRGGEVIGTWRRYNSALLMFLLRQRRSQRYPAAGDRRLAPWNGPEDGDEDGNGDGGIDWTGIDRMIAQAHARLLAGAEDTGD